ncbi:helix-turn-helix domain-containing protein [uncultured Devosia sp.]|uniref:helix-turn-helix domain-containing protein n=1 Tax=uncultured Devosia sp. TaxID=211434 RepID=UPI00260D9C8F|nr:helix-turn-helix domain-containing protein [uncultured Devosia sp.]
MDRARKLLHYLNMTSIPTYTLYGETDKDARQDWLHWETIQARSRLHDYRIAPHRHDQFFQVLHLSAGQAKMALDGDVHPLVPESVAVVPAGTVHGYAFSTDVRGLVVTLMERDLAGLGLPVPPAMVIDSGCGDIVAALARLTTEADRPGAAHDVAMRAHLTLLLVSLQRAGPESEAADAGGRAAQLVARFRELVEQGYRQSRRVADYADAIGISHTHLNRLCRQRLGLSALAVIEQRVALEARRQLLFSALPIKQIGAELGYDDPAYFSRFITRLYGMSPASLRDRMRRH